MSFIALSLHEPLPILSNQLDNEEACYTQDHALFASVVLTYNVCQFPTGILFLMAGEDRYLKRHTSL